jgi:AcrR family transcriptional regulator
VIRKRELRETMPTKGRATKAAKRVPRNTLSRARVIDGALALVDTDGLDAVTMPRLAKHLGVGTMSLYRHVDDKNDLINAVAERVLGDVQVPDGNDDDWEGRVVGYLRALRGAALAHPAIARILAERGLTVGPVFEQLEQAHSILRRAGFSDEGAVRAFYTLFTYVFGFVIWELPRVHEQPARSYVDSWNTAIDQLDINAFPTMHALREELTTAASTEQFEYGLDCLVRSLRPLS